MEIFSENKRLLHVFALFCNVGVSFLLKRLCVPDVLVIEVVDSLAGGLEFVEDDRRLEECLALAGGMAGVGMVESRTISALIWLCVLYPGFFRFWLLLTTLGAVV